MDWHGRRLLSGYGFAHLPSTAGPHRIEICLWRPVGSNEQELESYLLGSTLALTSHEPIYESAWRERCRLVTVSAGKIFIDLFVITRFLANQGWTRFSCTEHKLWQFPYVLDVTEIRLHPYRYNQPKDITWPNTNISSIWGWRKKLPNTRCACTQLQALARTIAQSKA